MYYNNNNNINVPYARMLVPRAKTFAEELRPLGTIYTSKPAAALVLTHAHNTHTILRHHSPAGWSVTHTHTHTRGRGRVGATMGKNTISSFPFSPCVRSRIDVFYHFSLDHHHHPPPAIDNHQPRVPGYKYRDLHVRETRRCE